MEFKSNNVPSQQEKVASSVASFQVSTKNLPSLGLSYPENCTIFHKPYTFGDIKRISGSKNLTVKIQIEEIISGIDCSFDKYDLTLSDTLYIGLLRKINTLGGSEVAVKYICSKCKISDKKLFKTSELEFSELLEDLPLEQKKLPITAKFSFNTVRFTPLTVKNYFKMIDAGLESDAIAKIAYETDQDFSVIYEQFKNMYNVDDCKILNRVDDLLSHTLKPLQFKCSCKNPISIELDGWQALLLPFRESDEPVESKLSFG